MKNLKLLFGAVVLSALLGSAAFAQNIFTPGNITAGGSITATGQISGAGSSTNDNAAAGNIGEYIYGGNSWYPCGGANPAPVGYTCPAAAPTFYSTSAPLMVTTVPVTVTQVSLTAGDWDCRAGMQGLPNSTTSVTQLAAWISSFAGTGLGTTPASTGISQVDWTAGLTWLQEAAIVSPALRLSVPPTRVSLSATSSVYLNAVAAFTASSLTGMGRLDCRRVR